MWVIYFLGKPTYWLSCDRLYSIGRKDTDVVILEDSSISRHHMNVSVGAVATIAALGQHVVEYQRRHGRIGVMGNKTSTSPSRSSRSPSRQDGNGHTTTNNALAAPPLMDEEELADALQGLFGSVTNVSELAALYPAAPLTFQDLSKYGSTLEYTDTLASRTGAARIGGGGATHHHDNNNQQQHVSIKLKQGAAPSPALGMAGAVPLLEGGPAVSPAVGGATDIISGGVCAAQPPAIASSVTLPPHIHKCRLRVGTHEAVFEFKWEPQFVLLGQTDGGGNSSSASHGANANANTHAWVLKSIANCGYVVINSKVDEIAARKVKAANLEKVGAAAAGGDLSSTAAHPPLAPTNTIVTTVPHTELPPHILKMTSFLLTSEINPTPLLMAAMCAGKPIVGLQFLENVLSRVSPKVPLPEATSTLAIPKKIHVFFTQLMGGGAAAGGGNNTNTSLALNPNTVDNQILSSTFIARQERTRLFSLTTFVTVQKAVFEELKSYVPLADGHIVFDEFLSRIARAHQQQQQEGGNGGDNSADGPVNAVIDAFFALNSHRVLVYLPPKHSSSSSSSANTETKAITALISAMHKRRMPSVEYTSLLSAIVRARKLDVSTSNAITGGGAFKNSARVVGDGAMMGAGDAGFLGQKRGVREGDDAGDGGRRTEAGNLFSDEEDVDATIDPVAKATQFNNSKNGVGGNNATGRSQSKGGNSHINALAARSKLLVTEGQWKSRDDLRANTSAVLLPDGSRAFLAAKQRNISNDEDDDDDALLMNGGVGASAAAGPPTNNRFTPHPSSPASSSSSHAQNILQSRSTVLASAAAASSRQLVAFDPLSGMPAAGSGIGADADGQQYNYDEPFPPDRLKTECIIEDDSLIISGPPQLPPFPCFQPYLIRGVMNGTIGGGADGVASPAADDSQGQQQHPIVPGGKVFRKQQFMQPAAMIELEPETATRLPGNIVGGGGGRVATNTIRTPANAAAPVVFHMDAADDDIIPEGNNHHHHHGGNHGSVPFNPFDIAAHNRQQRRAGGVLASSTIVSAATTCTARGGGRGGRAGGGAVRRSGAVAVNSDDDDVYNISEGNNNRSTAAARAPPAAGRGGRGRGARSAAAAVTARSPSPQTTGASSSVRTTARGGATAGGGAVLTAGLTSAMLAAGAHRDGDADEDDLPLSLGLGRNNGPGGGGGLQLTDTQQQRIDDIFDVDNLY